MRVPRLVWWLGVALVGAGVLWRGATRRWTLPCPTWLAWLVEGSLVDHLLGTEQTLDRIGLRPGLRVLEVGPGPGRLLIPAARRVLPAGEVVGLELQPGMIARLQDRVAAAGTRNLEVIQGDVTAEGIPPGPFDVVYLSAVLGEIPNRERALRNAHLMLRPGGTLSITEILPDPHYQSRRTVQRLAHAAGFVGGEVHGNWLRYTANFTKPESAGFSGGQ